MNNIWKYIFLLIFWPLLIDGLAQTHMRSIAGSEAQHTDIVSERIVIHTDRQLYIGGETIWFKIYAFKAIEKILSEYSKVVNIELISSSGIAVSRVKIALERGLGAGTFELPKETASGRYVLRAYTQAMRNTGVNSFCIQSIIILNPDQPIIDPMDESFKDVETFSIIQPSLHLSPKEDLNISIRSSRESYSQRSLITLEVSTTDQEGRGKASELSISVALQTPGDLKSKNGFHLRDLDEDTSMSSLPPEIIFEPEKFGLNMSGRIMNAETGMEEEDVEVFLSFPGKTAFVYSDKTDEDGRFFFLLPKLYGSKQVILQTRSDRDSLLSILLDDEFEEIETSENKEFVMPPEWVQVANTFSVNAQINQAYQAFELQPAYTIKNPFIAIPFYGAPDVRYNLDDYTRFPLPEFFFEVVPEVRVLGTYGNEKLRMINDWNISDKDIPLLLMVDGVPVFDQRTFLKINNKLIASADVVTAPFWLNPNLFDGVINLSSFDGDARCFVLPETAIRRTFLTFLPQRHFKTPEYNGNHSDRLPDFRNTLYWNPSIKTNEKGKAMVTFYSSDAVGLYDVRVEGVSENGLTGSGRNSMRISTAIE